MALSVRGLLKRVQVFRPDLPDAMGVDAIMEAVRRICRYTHLAVEVQTPVVLPLHTPSMTVTPSNSNALLRVEEVRIAPLLSTSSYKGTWDASTNTPSITTGSASSSNNGFFYIVSKAGTTTVDGLSEWNVGDIIYSNGTNWLLMDIQNYHTITQNNKPFMDQWQNIPQEAKNFPSYWTQEGNTIFFYTRPYSDLAIEITLSYIPVGEFDTIPLPTEAEDVIVDGAVETLASLPGTNFSQMLATARGIKFQKGLASLRAIGEFGYGGSPYWTPGNFSGRIIRLTSGRWL